MKYRKEEEEKAIKLEKREKKKKEKPRASQCEGMKQQQSTEVRTFLKEEKNCYCFILIACKSAYLQHYIH